jgi:hypothetical protein
MYLEMCPYGFDPTSKAKANKKIRLKIETSSKEFTGRFVLSFHAHAVEFEGPLNEITSELCTKIFQRFQNLGKVVSKINCSILYLSVNTNTIN